MRQSYLGAERNTLVNPNWFQPSQCCCCLCYSGEYLRLGTLMMRVANNILGNILIAIPHHNSAHPFLLNEKLTNTLVCRKPGFSGKFSTIFTGVALSLSRLVLVCSISTLLTLAATVVVPWLTCHWGKMGNQHLLSPVRIHKSTSTPLL